MSDTQQFTPEAVERLAEQLEGLSGFLASHLMQTDRLANSAAALRAYAQLLRQVAQAIHALDAINVERLDREEAHGDADVIALAAIPGIQAAWERVRERAGGFWYA